jgi:hypothetical protein
MTNLNLEHAEYRRGVDKTGRFVTYQVLLPVRGPYAAIRQFSEHVLISIPFASLDQMNFKRDAIATDAVAAQLRFTIYLALSAPEDTMESTGLAQGGAAE